MTQEIKIKDKTLLLDTETSYTGYVPETEDERDIRRALGLPVKKILIYYSNTHDLDSKIRISSYRITEIYNITSLWFTIEIILENGGIEKIHSDFLKDMQKPDFISEINKQTDI